MLRTPLNALPIYILRTMQTKISVDRIDDFLQEEEVDEQVSTIKGNKSGNVPFHEHLGFNNATLKWNTATQKAKKDKDAKPQQAGSSTRCLDCPYQSDCAYSAKKSKPGNCAITSK